MSRPWRIIVLLIVLAITAGAVSSSLMYAQLTNFSCTPPVGAGALCSRCYASFCSTLPDRAPLLCASFCSTPATIATSSAPVQLPPTIPVSPIIVRPPIGISSAAVYKSSSARASSVSSFNNPLGLTCTPLPAGTDGCSACLRALCPQYPESQAIAFCQSTCNILRGSSTSSKRTSVSSQQSSMRQPGGSYIEIPTSNAQMFEAAGEGWVSYGISRIHKNTIAPNGAQATASWEAQLPFAEYALYMYLPQNRETAEKQLMDTVPMNVNLNGTNFSFTVNQRNALPAFTQTIGGYGPETAIHNWYYLGTFRPVSLNGFEPAQTLRLFLPTGRASDAIKKPADGWVAAGDLRIYYTILPPQCGDGKCHDSERATCPVDCTDTPQCGNGYCDVRSGETLKTCTVDCGGTGVCGNLRCEGFNNENPGSCPSDCQYGGTTGGTTGGGGSSIARSSVQSRSSTIGNLYCGDGTCSGDIGENTSTCPKDCTGGSAPSSKPTEAYCGDGMCQTDKGENTTNCSKDCGGGAACGNGICDKDRNETAENCPKDCPSGTSSRASVRSSSKKSSTSSISSKREVNECGDGICSTDERDAFRFAMEGGLLCVVDCPGILKAGCSLTDKFGSTCTDSDCGVQPYIVGNVTYSNDTGAAPLKDFCIGTSAVAETACATDPYKNNALALRFYYNIDCPHGCANGVCKQGASPQQIPPAFAPAGVNAAPLQTTPPADTKQAPPASSSPSVAAPSISSPPSVIVPPATVSCTNQTGATESCRSCLRWVCVLLPNGQAEGYCSKYCNQTAPAAPAPLLINNTAAPVAPVQPLQKLFRVTDFGANLSDTLPDDRAFSQCLQSAISAAGTCSIGVGQLTLSTYAAELRSPNGLQIDAKGMVLEGMGDSTIIKGVSAKGFDVLQLNRVSNMTIRNVSITAEKTSDDKTQGVNGISMTNGTSNIVIDKVSVRDLPHVIKDDYIDGGKAFSVQTGKDPSVSSTDIIVRNSRSTRNAAGFVLESNPNGKTLPGLIEVINNTIEEGAFGVTLSFAAKTAGGTDVPGFSATIAENNFVNIRHPLNINRAPGVHFTSNVINTVKNPTIPDPQLLAFADHPFILLGASDGTFQGNTITYENETGPLFLIGGMPNLAFTENLVFSNNIIESGQRTGVKMQNLEGISVRKSMFGCNTIKNIVQPFYDPILSDFILQNIVSRRCNGESPLSLRSWWALLTNFTASLFK